MAIIDPPEDFPGRKGGPDLLKPVRDNYSRSMGRANALVSPQNLAAHQAQGELDDIAKAAGKNYRANNFVEDFRSPIEGGAAGAGIPLIRESIKGVMGERDPEGRDNLRGKFADKNVSDTGTKAKFPEGRDPNTRDSYDLRSKFAEQPVPEGRLGVKAILTEDGKLVSVNPAGELVEHPQDWRDLGRLVSESESQGGTVLGKAKEIGKSFVDSLFGEQSKIVPARGTGQAGGAMKAGERSGGLLSKAGEAIGEGVDAVGAKAKELGGKVADVAGEAGSKIAETAQGAVNAVKRDGPKIVKTGGAAIGRGAPEAIKQGAKITLPRLAAVLGIGAAATGVGAAAYGAYDYLSGKPAGEGEDAKAKEMGTADVVAPASAPASAAPSNLDDQTMQATAPQAPPPSDPGINTSRPPDVAQTPSQVPDTEIGRSMPKAAVMQDNVTGKTGPQAGVQTKGGFYPTYDKHSAEAGDFRTAFAAAVKSGVPTFTWQGREYNTRMA